MKIKYLLCGMRMYGDMLAEMLAEAEKDPQRQGLDEEELAGFRADQREVEAIIEHLTGEVRQQFEMAKAVIDRVENRRHLELVGSLKDKEACGPEHYSKGSDGHCEEQSCPNYDEPGRLV